MMQVKPQTISKLPCHLCQKKVTRLFPLERRNLTYFLCAYCWNGQHKNPSKIKKSKVDPTILTIDPSKVLTYEDVCIWGYQHQPLIHKVHKNLRKRPRS